MAKTFKHLFSEVYSFENLWRAYEKARRGKRYGGPAANFDMKVEDNLFQLQKEIESGTYRPGGYYHFYIYEPKKRLISAAPFRDRVVHHAIVNVLEPIYEARFSNSSYACRKGKGTHKAIERAHWGVRNCRWFLKGDIVKFFPSVDHGVLKEIIRRKIADRDLLAVIDRIIDSGAGILDGECPPVWFPGDDLLTPASRPRGMPIGNLTSQFFANVLLNELDQFVHQEIKPRDYLRYCDDFLLFDNDKEKLQRARQAIIGHLADLRLQAHPRKTNLRFCKQGVKFLGFRLTPSTRRVARDSINRFRKRMRRHRKERRQGLCDASRTTASVRGWIAHCRHANSDAMLRRVLNDITF